jgi:hypothetical protein
MNENQFSFTPQKGTIDAAMAIKAFVQEGLAAGEVIALVSLDVQGAFDAAWWPGILKELGGMLCSSAAISVSHATCSSTHSCAAA